MSKNLFLFSGQGSQYVGMAKDFYDNYESARRVFDIANEILEYDLAKIVFDGSEQQLSKTLFSQPAIMACSLCALESAKYSGIGFNGVAGHSLGEYAAMIASEMISLEDGFKLIKARAEAMENAAKNTKGIMCAVIGVSAKNVELACSRTDGYAVPANYNSPVQTVIAGEEHAVMQTVKILAAQKAKCIKLNVASAFHTKLMQPAADEFLKAAEKIKFHLPKIDFFSNVTGSLLEDFSDMPTLLAKHIVSPVRFVSELSAADSAGYKNYVELGPSRVLTGLVKKTLKSKNAVNIENIKTLEKAVEILK